MADRPDWDAFQAEVERLTKEREEIFRALHPECWAHPGIPNSCTVEMCDCFDSHELAQQVAQLRADLRALVPLARLGLVALDDDDGKVSAGDGIRLGVLDGRFVETPVVTQARALLAREGTDA